MTPVAALTLGRALAVRAAPGLINLATLSLVARAASADVYGIFSLIVTTAGLVSNTLFGLVILPIVAQYATHQSQDRHSAYASTLGLLVGLLTLPLIVVGGVAASFTPIAGSALSVVLILSLHTLLQELLRARQSLYLYGTSDLAQSCGFLAATLIFLDVNYNASNVALLFAASYLPAVAVSLFGLRELKLARPSLSMAREIVSVGRWLVLNTLTENLLFTGARYLVLSQAGAQTLGVFSYAVDIAQRTVAFMVNAASFIYVPKAFLARATDGHAAFIHLLREGVVVSVLAAGAVMAFVTIGASTFYGAYFLSPTFDVALFCIVSVAAVINRIKKLLLDSLGMATGRSSWLAVGNIVGALIGLSSMWLLARIPNEHAISVGYLLGYLMIFVATWALMTARKQIFTTPARTPLSDRPSGECT